MVKHFLIKIRSCHGQSTSKNIHKAYVHIHVNHTNPLLWLNCKSYAKIAKLTKTITIFLDSGAETDVIHYDFIQRTVGEI